jgi:hypothetical protein
VTVVALFTPLVVTVKFAAVLPAATVTLTGVTASVLSSESVTTAPPVGAGPFKVAVPVVLLPPVTLVGLNVMVESTGGLIVKLPVWELAAPALNVPVTVTVAAVATPVVVTVNVAVVAPLETTTLAGVVAAVLSSVSVTVLWAAVPDAGPFKVTVPMDEVPPVTEVGLMVIDVRARGMIVSVTF